VLSREVMSNKWPRNPTGWRDTPTKLSRGESHHACDLLFYNHHALHRLLHLQRALQRQCWTTSSYVETMRQRGLWGMEVEEEEEKGQKETTKLTTSYFMRPKRARTRRREGGLEVQLEALKLKVQLHRSEVERAQKRLDETQTKAEEVRKNVEETSCQLMGRFHTFAKDKNGLQDWRRRRLTSEATCAGVSEAVAASKFALMASLKTIFPINTEDAASSTLRFVRLPTLDQQCRKQDDMQALSVALGWTTQVLCVVSAVLDVPLRYPLVHRGSLSSAVDPRKQECSYPLHMVKVQYQGNESNHHLPMTHFQSSDQSRAGFALYLLNQNVSQLRWLCGLVTGDAKCTLRNLQELMR